MTKLLEWLSVAGALFAMWSSIVFGYVKSPFLDDHMNLVIFSPFIFVFLFGVYAASVVLYRVFTFNNCEKAAEELQKHIAEARKDLQRKGFVSS